MTAYPRACIRARSLEHAAADAHARARMAAWFVYLVRTSDDVLYTGVSTDVDRRVGAHEAGRGAKFLRGRGPLEVAFRCRIGDRGLAQQIEVRLKRLTRSKKEAIVRALPARRRLLRMLGAEELPRRA